MKDLSSIVILIFLIPAISFAQNEPELVRIKNHTDLIVDYLPKRIKIEETYLNNYFKGINHIKQHSNLGDLSTILMVKDQNINQLIAKRTELSLKKDEMVDITKSLKDKSNRENVYISDYSKGLRKPINEKRDDEKTNINKKKNSEIDILLTKREQRFLEEKELINSRVNDYLVSNINFSNQSEVHNSIGVLSNTNTAVKETDGNSSLKESQLVKIEIKSKSNDYLVQEKQFANDQVEKTIDFPKKKEVEGNVDQVILSSGIESKEVVTKDDATDDATKIRLIEKEEFIAKKVENSILEVEDDFKVNNNLVALSEVERLQLERSRLLKLYGTKFTKTTFLVQVSSLNEDIPEREVANNLGIKERLIKYTINGSTKYFLGGFKTYEKAKEKVITLKNQEVNSFILVKRESDFILPSLFFQDK